MRSAWTAAVAGFIAACGGAVFAQSGAPAIDAAASPYGVLASLDTAKTDGVGLAAMSFPLTLPAPEPAMPLPPEMFDPRPMWPSPVGRADVAPKPIAAHDADIQTGAVVTARY